MAKVTGPLMSMSASGKLGNALVYFPWKGISVVREWLKPANPQTGAQGDRRTMLGGLGRGGGAVNKLSQFAEYAREVTPTGQTWISRYVQYINNTYFADATDFATHDAEEGAHGAHLDWVDESQDLGLAHFKMLYRAMATQFTQSHQLYCLAKYATDQYLLDNTKIKESPYSTALADWNLAKIQEMVAHFAEI